MSKALREQLGGALPAGVESLDAAARDRLAQRLQGAKHRQRAHIETALQAALSHLPALLRGPVRKLFDA